MDYLPIFYRLSEQACLIVGGGEVASRKSATLRQAGGRVTVLAPKLCDALRALKDEGHIHWLEKRFEPEDVEGYNLVIAATAEREVNEQVSKAARKHHIPVNVVDCLDLCSFIFPAIIDRSPIIAAVSSGGASPVLARLLRMRLETLIPPGYGVLARLAERFRERVKKTLADGELRRRFWESALQGDIAELAFAGKEEEAALNLERRLSATDSNGTHTGMVFLVGAGPGDPDLLTLRALRLIQEADVVVYDRLVSPEIMNLVRRDAEKIYAGKQRSLHALPQDRINRLLADLAKSGKRVVRLKGGDPFIFGRGGEEIETLMEESIPFQIVPGITAASGCAAYAGIPLTHRDYAQSCAFVTGHLKDGAIALDWSRLVVPHQTLVIYMGLQGLEQICAELIRHGCPADLPAALIQQGTTPQQRVLAGTLADLPEIVSRTEVRAPTLVIVGQVVRLHEKLAWFGNELTKPG
ncbi:MAG: siroheme synthase CysG [Methylococcaceae bacterium]|nr:siroheme synthase CysG [Methylococcaceae bacterium]